MGEDITAGITAVTGVDFRFMVTSYGTAERSRKDRIYRVQPVESSSHGVRHLMFTAKDIITEEKG